MTDKVQKIITEIKDRISNYQEYIDSGYNDEEVIKQEELKDLLTFINPLQEESASEDLEEASKNYALNNTPWDDCKDEIQESFKAGANWQKTKEESVNEDLEEAADDALNSVLNTHEIINVRSCLEMFRLGAKWQKQQDQSTIELAEDHAMLAGMNKMEQQIMTKAVDGIARPYDNEIWCILDSFNLEDGDEVKVIVIKKK